VKGATTISVAGDSLAAGEEANSPASALVIAWSQEEPHRVGELALFVDPGRPHVIGRGDDNEGDSSAVRAYFIRQRPGANTAPVPLGGRSISRRQLVVTPRSFGLEIERVGRVPMVVNGVQVDRHSVHPGDTVLLKGQLLLHCVRRARVMPELRFLPDDDAPFGEPDRLGILGESPLVWHLRDQLAFAAKADTHVLLTGASGTGKELAARAIHALSRRAKRPLVSRNAATFPSGLIDAELFGNVKSYPNPGMPERPGLVGQADGGTLFLDEIAELPLDMQAHLLRVLDEGGEYQRLGEATARRADVRLVGATNRDPSYMKHDLLARLTVRIALPTLDERREDVPLLVRHLLLRAAKKSPEIGERFVRKMPDGRPDVQVDASLVEVLLRADLETNVRELDAILWRALAASGRDAVSLPEDMLPRAEAPEPSAEAIRASLGKAEGNVARAAKELRLSRYALYRLMRRHGL